MKCKGILCSVNFGQQGFVLVYSPHENHMVSIEICLTSFFEKGVVNYQYTLVRCVCAYILGSLSR